jgi:hypothetical protein
VREFINWPQMLEMKLSWEGQGIHEKACDEKGQNVVAIAAPYTSGRLKWRHSWAIRLNPEKNCSAPRISFPEFVRGVVEAKSGGESQSVSENNSSAQ